MPDGLVGGICRHVEVGTGYSNLTHVLAKNRDGFRRLGLCDRVPSLSAAPVGTSPAARAFATSWTGRRRRPAIYRLPSPSHRPEWSAAGRTFCHEPSAPPVCGTHPESSHTAKDPVDQPRESPQLVRLRHRAPFENRIIGLRCYRPAETVRTPCPRVSAGPESPRAAPRSAQPTDARDISRTHGCASGATALLEGGQGLGASGVRRQVAHLTADLILGDRASAVDVPGVERDSRPHPSVTQSGQGKPQPEVMPITDQTPRAPS